MHLKVKDVWMCAPVYFCLQCFSKCSAFVNIQDLNQSHKQALQTSHQSCAFNLVFLFSPSLPWTSFSSPLSVIMTGAYNSFFRMFDRETGRGVTLEAWRESSKPRAVLRTRRVYTSGKRRRGDVGVDSLDFTKKILHMAWHPSENIIAIAATNNLYIFQDRVNPETQTQWQPWKYGQWQIQCFYWICHRDINSVIYLIYIHIKYIWEWGLDSLYEKSKPSRFTKYWNLVPIGTCFCPHSTPNFCLCNCPTVGTVDKVQGHLCWLHKVALPTNMLWYHLTQKGRYVLVRMNYATKHEDFVMIRL